MKSFHLAATRMMAEGFCQKPTHTSTRTIGRLVRAIVGTMDTNWQELSTEGKKIELGVQIQASQSISPIVFYSVSDNAFVETDFHVEQESFQTSVVT